MNIHAEAFFSKTKTGGFFFGLVFDKKENKEMVDGWVGGWREKLRRTYIVIAVSATHTAVEKQMVHCDVSRLFCLQQREARQSVTSRSGPKIGVKHACAGVPPAWKQTFKAASDIYCKKLCENVNDVHFLKYFN